MRYFFAFCGGLLPIITASQACDLGSIAERLEQPLDRLKKIEREVSDIQSTEGGDWQIYREGDGRVHSIVRADYGESGRYEVRFSAVNRGDYGISVTRFDYNRRAFADTGTPLEVVKQTTDSFFFCGGQLQLADGSSSMLPEDHKQRGLDARQEIFGSKDVADFTPGFAR